MSLTNNDLDESTSADLVLNKTVYEKGTKNVLTSRNSCVLKCGDD